MRLNHLHLQLQIFKGVHRGMQFAYQRGTMIMRLLITDSVPSVPIHVLQPRFWTKLGLNRTRYTPHGNQITSVALIDRFASTIATSAPYINANLPEFALIREKKFHATNQRAVFMPAVLSQGAHKP